MSLFDFMERVDKHKKEHADVPVLDMFKVYQKHILENAKKSDIDFVKEIFAKTELFDVSRVGATVPMKYIPKNVDGTLISPLAAEVTIPFESCFVKVYNDNDETNGVFIREYSPEILTGAAFMMNRVLNTNVSYPFVIDLNKMELSVKLKDALNILYKLYGKVSTLAKSEIEFFTFSQFNDIAMLIHLATSTLDKLNTYATLVDHAVKTEYYSRKGKPALKVTNRPIYYVLNKENYEKRKYDIKPMSKLEYSFSFHVRGHWRKLQDGKIGKNRAGEYKVSNFTWVKDFVKGEGELVKRIRIVK